MPKTIYFTRHAQVSQLATGLAHLQAGGKREPDDASLAPVPVYGTDSAPV